MHQSSLTFEEALDLRRQRLQKLAEGNVAIATIIPDPLAAAKLIDHAIDMVERAHKPVPTGIVSAPHYGATNAGTASSGVSIQT